MIFSNKGGDKAGGIRKAKILLPWFFVFVFLAGAGYFAATYLSFSPVSYLKKWLAKNNPVSNSEKTKKTSKSKKEAAGIAVQEKKIYPDKNQAEDKTIAVSESENYKIKSLTFGGDAVSMADAEKSAQLEIYDIKSESFIGKNNNEAKIVIYWKTNKLAISQVEYSRNGGQNPKVAKEASYGFGHSAVLSGLEPATAYIYQVKTRDRWGNEAASGHYGAYTGSKIISVFELIGKAMGDIFGWAINR